MVDRFVTKPLELPAADSFSRAELVIYGLDHSGASYEGRIFFDAPDAGHDAPRSDPHYAGSFYILGHGGCFGDVGHCDVPTRTDPYDLRPPHQLLPAIRVVDVTEHVRRMIAAKTSEVVVTVVAHATADNPNDVLTFETLRLATYA